MPGEGDTFLWDLQNIEYFKWQWIFWLKFAICIGVKLVMQLQLKNYSSWIKNIYILHVLEKIGNRVNQGYTFDAILTY